MPHPFATHAGVRRPVTAGIAAPSVHNTQLWRFRRNGGTALELHADLDRRLTVIDPRGQALHVSCGAALLNLRPAIRTTGHQPQVKLLPEPRDKPTLASAARAEGAALNLPGPQITAYLLSLVAAADERPACTDEYTAEPARRTRDRPQPLDLRTAAPTDTAEHSQGHIQAIIRSGHGPPVPGTPRRPSPEVLIHA